jgi:hypothetical protein
MSHKSVHDARLFVGGDGSFALRYADHDKAVLIEGSRGQSSARILEHSRNAFTEAVISPARTTCAHVKMLLRRRGDHLSRRVISTFPSGAVRVDEENLTAKHDGTHYQRQSTWNFSQNRVARAHYADGKRTLHYIYASGERTMRTSYTVLPNGFMSQTENSHGGKSVDALDVSAASGPVVIGPAVPTPGSSYTVVTGNGSYTATVLGSNGSWSASGVITTSGGAQVAVSGILYAPDAGQPVEDGPLAINEFSATSTNPDGSVTTGTQGSYIYGSTDSSGAIISVDPSQSFSVSSGAQANADGTFSVTTTVTSPDGTVEQSSTFESETDGSSDEVTTTYNTDGTYTVTATATDAAGDVGTSSATYSSDGELIEGDTETEDLIVSLPPFGATPDASGIDLIPEGIRQGLGSATFTSLVDAIGPLGIKLPGLTQKPRLPWDINPPDPPPPDVVGAVVNAVEQELAASTETENVAATIDLRPYLPRHNGEVGTSVGDLLAAASQALGKSAVHGAKQLVSEFEDRAVSS